jgi:hypothetical protein
MVLIRFFFGSDDKAMGWRMGAMGVIQHKGKKHCSLLDLLMSMCWWSGSVLMFQRHQATARYCVHVFRDYAFIVIYYEPLHSTDWYAYLQIQSVCYLCIWNLYCTSVEGEKNMIYIWGLGYVYLLLNKDFVADGVLLLFYFVLYVFYTLIFF